MTRQSPEEYGEEIMDLWRNGTIADDEVIWHLKKLIKRIKAEGGDP
ncbi:MAG: hypothetical protein MPK62_00685 [Alphaproteobacteria bacterium]|nr:hypothetical protein [Alphaproteobacteria bacterium]MDA8029654.1 hypothetical protein [Alphaproteobacteria bacterium]